MVLTLVLANLEYEFLGKYLSTLEEEAKPDWELAAHFIQAIDTCNWTNVTVLGALMILPKKLI